MNAGSALARAVPERAVPAMPAEPPPPVAVERSAPVAPPWLPIAAFTAVTFALCWIKYRWYLYDDIDLAVFVQALARGLEGSTFGSIRGMSWLGDHASYVLFPLVPLYAVARHPLLPLAAQCAVLALGAIPVHRMALRALAGPPGATAAREERGQRLAAMAFATTWLLQPALAHVALF